MKKRVKKKKIKIFRVFITLMFLTLLIVAFTFLCKIRVKGYYISGNTYYTDQEILNITSLSKYPSYLLTTSYSVNSKIKSDKLIENIKIKKTLLGKFKVIVNEKNIVFYDSIKKKSITSNGDEIDFYYENSPVLVNEISNKKIYNNIVNKFNNIDKDIKDNISEIKYDPNDIDKERFLFSINDGNYVYITLSKFNNINNYLEIASTLGEKNGILYLDYGNYFVPKE